MLVRGEKRKTGREEGREKEACSEEGKGGRGKKGKEEKEEKRKKERERRTMYCEVSSVVKRIPRGAMALLKIVALLGMTPVMLTEGLRGRARGGI